jgi:flavin-dependent dehydrogenase
LNEGKTYDVAILGGGLAGLALSIQLLKSGYSVITFEKEKYPFHKVCGEYISLESWNFLEDVGIPLSDWDLPIIKRLVVSSPGGGFIEHELPLGGFGISRFKLDSALASLCRALGGVLEEDTKVTEVAFENKGFRVQAGDYNCRAKVVCGTFGKRSNLDIRWKRKFIRKKNNKLNNFIAVKYHVSLDSPADLISLHNFRDGYCGLSQVEDQRYCLCYLTTANNLQRSNNSIDILEKNVLSANPHLQKIFSSAKFLFDQPLTISQISFEKKNQVRDHILFVGDAAGMITPLCGNGMSMALHGSKIAFECIREFLEGEVERHEMEQNYADRWGRQFRKRLRAGRFIQFFFGSPALSNMLIRTLRPFPRVITWLIKKTHGQPF